MIGSLNFTTMFFLSSSFLQRGNQIIKLALRGAAAARAIPLRLLCMQPLRTAPPGKAIQDTRGGGSLQGLQNVVCACCARVKIKSSPHKQSVSLDNNSNNRNNGEDLAKQPKTFPQKTQTLSLGALAPQLSQGMVFPFAYLGLFPEWKLLR